MRSICFVEPTLPVDGQTWAGWVRVVAGSTGYAGRLVVVRGLQLTSFYCLALAAGSGVLDQMKSRHGSRCGVVVVIGFASCGAWCIVCSSLGLAVLDDLREGHWSKFRRAQSLDIDFLACKKWFDEDFSQSVADFSEFRHLSNNFFDESYGYGFVPCSESGQHGQRMSLDLLRDREELHRLSFAWEKCKYAHPKGFLHRQSEFCMEDLVPELVSFLSSKLLA